MDIRLSPSQKPRYPIDIAAAVRVLLDDKRWPLEMLVTRTDSDPQTACRIIREDLWLRPELMLSVCELLIPLNTSVPQLLASIDNWERRATTEDTRKYVRWITWKYILITEVPQCWHYSLMKHTDSFVRAEPVQLSFAMAARDTCSLRSVRDIAFEYNRLRGRGAAV